MGMANPTGRASGRLQYMAGAVPVAWLPRLSPGRADARYPILDIAQAGLARLFIIDYYDARSKSNWHAIPRKLAHSSPS